LTNAKHLTAQIIGLWPFVGSINVIVKPDHCEANVHQIWRIQCLSFV